jgi:1,4-dihydroxy-2-naphthoate polyprenyltransferase
MKHWLEAARLRTLPLSVSGIIVGTFFAMSQSVFNWKIVFFCLSTTLGLQVLSNFANDYGDGVKGTDNDSRIGPKRAVQSGVISASQMKSALWITALLTLLSALLLIYVSFKDKYLGYSVFFLLLGIGAIAAAIFYTVGKKAYGYHGWGDFFVFVFFGLVSTLGSYFLFTKEIYPNLLLPAAAVGLLSAAVLNLNNMRDEFSDRASNKRTLVVKMGGKKAIGYHSFLIISPMMFLLLFAFLENWAWDQYLFVLMFFPLIKHLVRVYNAQKPEDFDPELKKLALTTFGLSLLLGACMIYLVSDIIV